jgi:hypothetical protein
MGEPEPEWSLMEWDLFDPESPPSVRARGQSLRDGLRALWELTLEEGVNARGVKTLASFTLRWEGEPPRAAGDASIPVDVTGNPELLKLRRWVSDQRGDLLTRLAELHLRLLQSDARWIAGGGEAQAEAREILARAGRLDSPVLLG